MNENKKPTYKQIKFLMAIEEELDIKCEGKTRQEVSEFISKNIDKYQMSKELRDDDCEEYDLNYGNR